MSRKEEPTEAIIATPIAMKSDRLLSSNHQNINLRLLQLCSPMLPIGAYAYSQGMEFAVSAGWVKDESTAADWIQGLLKNALLNLDLPILSRIYKAWQAGDENAVLHWNNYLYASRESAELRAEDRQLAQALARLLMDLGFSKAHSWIEYPKACFLSLFSLGAVNWQISLEDASRGYLWMWAENQTLSAIKLVPLGQTAGQKILSTVAEIIPGIVRSGLELDEDSIGFIAPGQAMASALHETQYTRLFRS